ncbi:aminotransferase class III-fold pyridoxal phosphate-dependent enzyme [Massilia sp. PWRC2]|uniref:aminotransferase class III-fold pyridoxal phosphate-dependent enzyme n=1 Tax=Massilia sp. PWRC2 TaxID=2804626 RepID=UPI003CEC2954
MSAATAADALIASYCSELGGAAYRDGAASRLAGGAPHDSWRFAPFPIVFERAAGGYKWDVSGRRYIDLWTGHGSLMFGNAQPAVVEAVTRQIALGQHLGGVHRLHHEWAELLCQLVPSCERVRFTGSGTEATLLAMRVARAWTGRARIVRIDGNFHGWHDDALAHAMPATAAGFNPGGADFIDLAAPLDIDSVAELLVDDDVAAVFVEPGGGSAGCLPWSAPYLAALRKLTEAHGTLLVFDEVISCFRYAAGGVQQLAGVTPDLTVMAKIAAGGMPGGVVGGKASLLGVIGGGPMANGQAAYAPHSGTFNGFALSAAAALATLPQIADGNAVRAAASATARLVDGINDAARACGVDVRAFHQSSIFHLMIGAVAAGEAAAPGAAAIGLTRSRAHLHRLLRAALLLEHIDCHASHGWVSAVHERAAIDEAIGCFARAFERLRALPEFAAPAQPLQQLQHLQPSAASDTCTQSCHQPDCAARVRMVAGCSLPISTVSAAP